ncbi:MAG: hypothetical protein ACYTG5_10695 [Planctomycetota bacterium]|jgi:ELWxxDGT repeat protein
MQAKRLLALVCAGLFVFTLQSCTTLPGDGDENSLPPEGGMSDDINKTGGGFPAMGGGAAFSGVLSRADHGNEGSNPESFTVVGNRLYFAADDGVSGRELWQFIPGVGARLAADVLPGSGPSNPEDLIRVGNILFFTALDGGGQRILWRYRGGRVVRVEKFSGQTVTDVAAMIALQKNLILFQEIGSSAFNAWYVDASGSTAEPLAGWGGMRRPQVLAVAKSFFVLRETGEPEQLYTGTAHSIRRIDRGRLESFGSEFAELRGDLFFNGEDEFGQELWVFRPTRR